MGDDDTHRREWARDVWSRDHTQDAKCTPRQIPERARRGSDRTYERKEKTGGEGEEEEGEEEEGRERWEETGGSVYC